MKLSKLATSYNASVMVQTALIPEKTVITAKGDGVPADLSGASSRVFLVNLRVTDIVEQESFELQIFGSADGQAFSPKPLLSFAQQFYRGETPMLLDLSAHPDVKFVRAHWEVNRWGKGSETPRFEVSATIREVPPEMLKKYKGRTRRSALSPKPFISSLPRRQRFEAYSTSSERPRSSAR